MIPICAWLVDLLDISSEDVSLASARTDREIVSHRMSRGESAVQSLETREIDKIYPDKIFRKAQHDAELGIQHSI